MSKAFYGQNKTVVWTYWYWRNHDWGNGPGAPKNHYGWFREGEEPFPHSEGTAMRDTSIKTPLFKMWWGEQEPPFAPVKIQCEMYLTPAMQEYFRREHLADVHCYFKTSDDLGKIPRRCEVSYYFYPFLGYNKSEEWVKCPPHNGMEIADNVKLTYIT